MATMTTGDRAMVHAEMMRELSRLLQSCATVKADGRAAIDAIDQWASDNMASFNAALPTAARNNWTASQKALAFMMVLQRRFIAGV